MCQDFIKKLNGLVPGMETDLPTEAQWEYACRVGTTTPFSFGENITLEQVNYHGNLPYNKGKKGRYRGKTVEVKSLPPNPRGLYEMHGNVREWCADWYGEYLDKALENPTGSVSGKIHVARGGSWFNTGGNCRSACRLKYFPGYRNGSTGFRLSARSPEVR